MRDAAGKRNIPSVEAAKRDVHAPPTIASMFADGKIEARMEAQQERAERTAEAILKSDPAAAPVWTAQPSDIEKDMRSAVDAVRYRTDAEVAYDDLIRLFWRDLRVDNSD